jgi:hypothetical protein
MFNCWVTRVKSDKDAVQMCYRGATIGPCFDRYLYQRPHLKKLSWNLFFLRSSILTPIPVELWGQPVLNHLQDRE